ncbi:MAG TPA: carbohydrate-binding family 9-like protein [Pyrinomonadaceae bacterium]|nr:carbohydrate-binding family 9-like protein [Pyrinomonadaceae bacterium]
MTITARYVEQPVGESDFENPAWENFQPVRIEHYWSGEPATPAKHAEVRLCWSSEALHVRFVCAQQEPLIVAENPRIDQKTLGLWDRDVCEIFIAPDPEKPRRYFEFEAAPTGEWVDLGITLTPSGRETDWDFRSGFTTAARLDKERLFVGMRIPWSEAIPKPKEGEVWRVNLFRCAGPEAPERYLAWRPTHTPEPNFHVPEAFGSLLFSL